jgi:hypothetical protein
VQNSAAVAGCSTGQIYNLARTGRLVLKKLAGRTLVDTSSLIAFIDSAEPWSPSDRNKAANAARVKSARAAWEA